jgi:dihydrofolate reductase
MLYREALPLVDKMYITIIDQIVEGDTYFPEFNEDDFVITEQERFEGETPYTYITYDRKR